MPIGKIAPYRVPQLCDVPASRAQWPVDASRAVLLVHDVQRYFLEPYSEGQSPFCSLLENIKALSTACRRSNVPVVFSAQPGEQSRKERGLLWDLWGPGIVAAPEMEGFRDDLGPERDDILVSKRRYSAFFETDLFRLLEAGGRSQLWITGVYGHIGCLATAVDGFMRGIEPIAVSDAIADFSREDHLTALRQVARTCGAVMDTKSLLQHVERAGSDDSRAPIRSTSVTERAPGTTP